MVLKVAIIGGGIGGLAAALALSRQPGVLAEVYERATELREVGALIGMSPNGLRTLEKLGVGEALGDDIGWRSPNGVPMAIRHYQTNEVLSENYNVNVPDKRHHFSRMTRVDLHNAIRRKLPRDVKIHLGKKAVRVEAHENSATVTFEDGTQVAADLIVGADGIRSAIRSTYVPDHELHWSGDAIFRTVFPYSLVQDIPNIPQDSIHYHSPRSWIFPTRIGADGFGVTASYHIGNDDTDPDAPFRDIVWNAPAEVSTIRDLFKGFCHPVPAIIERIPEGTLRRYANVSGNALAQWNFGHGRVTLLGDAAHTHGGMYAAGASLAIDDAYALHLALAASVDPQGPEHSQRKQIARATQLYEETRRPHVERLLREVSRGREMTAARSKAARQSGVLETDEAFRARIALRDGVWLFEHDVEDAFNKVQAAHSWATNAAQPGVSMAETPSLAVRSSI
jgi:salicylate hydroxylase